MLIYIYTRAEPFKTGCSKKGVHCLRLRYCCLLRKAKSNKTTPDTVVPWILGNTPAMTYLHPPAEPTCVRHLRCCAQIINCEGLTDPVLSLLNCSQTHWGHPYNIQHVWYSKIPNFDYYICTSQARPQQSMLEASCSSWQCCQAMVKNVALEAHARLTYNC